MALPQNFIELVNVVGAVLLHFLWQGVLIGAVYALAQPFFPGMSARYRVGLIALVALALCPLVTLAYLMAGFRFAHGVVGVADDRRHHAGSG